MKSVELFATLCVVYSHFLFKRGGAIAQSEEQWSRDQVTRVRNQWRVPFGKGINPHHYHVPQRGEDLKPSAVWLLTYKHLCFLSRQIN